MEEKVRDNQRDYAEATILTERQAEYLAKARTVESAKQLAKLMGVRLDTVRDTMDVIASKLGKPVLELTGWKRQVRSKAAGANELYKLAKDQEFRCALSGLPLEPSDAALDHIVPVAKGGTDEIGNLQWVHSVINKMKGSLDNDEFVAMCRKVSQWQA